MSENHSYGYINLHGYQIRLGVYIFNANLYIFVLKIDDKSSLSDAF